MRISDWSSDVCSSDLYCYQLDGHLTDLQIRKVVKWFFYAQIRTRYVSQLPQKLDRDLKVIKDSSQPFDDLLQIIKDERTLEISPDEFVGRAISHPLYPMLRWYFKRDRKSTRLNSNH